MRSNANRRVSIKKEDTAVRNKTLKQKIKLLLFETFRYEINKERQWKRQYQE